MSAPTRIWFNRTFSSAHHAVTLIRANPDRRAVEVHGTHESLDAVFLGACDVVGVEPTRSELSAEPPETYLDFALEYCRRHRIEVFVPKRYAGAMAARREDFAALGTRLLVAGSAAAMDAVSDKAELYATAQRLAPGSAPRFEVARTAAEFRVAHEAIAATGAVVCFKPARGEGGGGFRILDAGAGPLAALAGHPSERVPLAGVLAALDGVECFDPLVISECLTDAAEYSLDCLAQDGELLVAVPRHKLSARAQRIERAPELVAIAGALAREYRLHALFNVQFLVGADGPKVIDLNPRMAAGIDVAAAAGVNLPWLGVRQALGEQFAVPEPAYGVTVGRIDSLVTVSAAA